MSTSRVPSAYAIGDVVVWRLPDGSKHIGFVVPGPGSRSAEKWAVYNMGEGVEWGDTLLDFEIVGHYRYGK